MLGKNTFSVLLITVLTILNAGIYYSLFNKLRNTNTSSSTTSEQTYSHNQGQKGINVSLSQLEPFILNGMPVTTKQFRADPSDTNHYYLEVPFDEKSNLIFYKEDAYGDKNNLEKIVFTGNRYDGEFNLKLVEMTSELLNIITQNDTDEQYWLAKLCGSTIFKEFPSQKIFELNNKKVTFNYYENADIGTPIYTLSVEYSPVSLTLGEYIEKTQTKLAPSVNLIEQSTTNSLNKKFITQGLKDVASKKIQLYIEGIFKNKDTQEETKVTYADLNNIVKVDDTWDGSDIHGDGYYDSKNSKKIATDANGELETQLDFTLFDKMHTYINKSLILERIDIEIVDNTEGSDLFGLPLVKKSFTVTQASE